MRDILKEILQCYGVRWSRKSTISTVKENNFAALTLANTPMPKLASKSKTFAIMYNWLDQRSHVKEDVVEVKKIHTRWPVGQHNDQKFAWENTGLWRGASWNHGPVIVDHLFASQEGVSEYQSKPQYTCWQKGILCWQTKARYLWLSTLTRMTCKQMKSNSVFLWWFVCKYLLQSWQKVLFFWKPSQYLFYSKLYEYK